MAAATNGSERGWILWWWGIVAALAAVLFVPPGPAHVSGVLRVVLWPAEWSLAAAGSHVSWFPLFAAGELVVLGWGAELVRRVVAR